MEDILEKIFTTYEKITGLGNLKLKNDQEQKLEPYLLPASLEVKRYIGSAKYDAIREQTDDYTSDDFDKVQLAETYLVLKYALPNLNLNSSGSGFTKAVGVNDGRQENLSEQDIDSLIERYEDNAINILREYQIDFDAEEDGNKNILVAGNLKIISY